MNDEMQRERTGAWLKTKRLEAGITQRELAEQVGAPAAAWIEEIEAGRRAVPAPFFRGFARTFSMPVREFVRRCAAANAGRAIDAAA